MVAVPTHFFKVVLAERESPDGNEGEENAVLGAFVLPNAPVQPTTPLTAFSVPVEALEEAAGRRLAWLFTSQFRVESCLGDLQQP